MIISDGYCKINQKDMHFNASNIVQSVHYALQLILIKIQQYFGNHLTKIMGNSLCMGNQQSQRLQVHSLPDPIPHSPSYRLFKGITNRYSDLTVMSLDSLSYIFTLKIQQHRQLQITLPVLNELPQRAIYINYKLQILKKIIIDPLDDQYENTFIAVKNDVTGVQYSMRIIPFKSYNSLQFKKGMEEVWLHQKKITKKYRNLYLTLDDAFVYGISPDHQALVLLFQRTNSNLLNIGEYRRQANWPWTLPEKLTIFQSILQSCQKLLQMQIIHRDIRPSNIYFLDHLNKYVVGNFATARESFELEEDDLMTVYGCQALAYDKVAHLISQKSNMGIYNPTTLLYQSLQQVLSYLQTMNTVQIHCRFQQKIMQDIQSQLNSHTHLRSIMAYIARIIKQSTTVKVQLFDDHLVSKLAQRLLTQKYKQEASEHQFRTYQLMGYYKQFSEMAHKIIQKNNINEQPFKNAYILKDLGYFYQQNGTGGIEYILNSCILFCKQVELDLQYRLYDDAEEHLTHAEQLYLKLSTISDFSLNLIQINRLKALLKIKRSKGVPQEQNQAIVLINKTLSLAGDKNLPLQKQMKLFLSWGIIYRQCHQVQLAHERLNNGLSISQNTAAFVSPSAAILFKSHFLFQLGVIYFNKIKDMHNPQLSIAEQQYNKFDYKGRAESYFKLSLQIRERQSTNPFEIIQGHLMLGSFYLMQNNYIQSKTNYKKGLIKLKLIKDKMSDQILVQLYYDLGSVCYKLKQYKDAQVYYRSAIKILEQTEIDDYWKYCIMGNLALSKIRCGEIEGHHELQTVKDIIRLKNGQDHYDYIFLQKEENAINNRQSRF